MALATAAPGHRARGRRARHRRQRACQGTAIHFELPPLRAPATREHHPGKVIWADLVTPDLAGAKRFYGSLFGWTFTDIHTATPITRLPSTTARASDGILQRTVKAGRSNGQPAWLTFISVRDVAAAERIILSQGGKVLSKPRNYAQRGPAGSAFADPQGAVFAVLQSSSGDPPDELADPGEWIWSSLVTRNPGKGAAFYQAVFGYDAFDFPDGRRHGARSPVNQRLCAATTNALPETATKAHPHWLNFLRVVSTPRCGCESAGAGGGGCWLSPIPIDMVAS